MSHALLDAGDLAVELVPAAVVVAHEITGKPSQGTKSGEGFLGTGRQRPVPHQPFVG